jgi:uncharacterized protein (TIGR02145 family)
MSKTVSKLALTAGFALAMAFTFSCSGDDEGGGGGGGGGGGSACSADFGAVTIGSQTWAAKNLNCDVEGSKCYGNNPANCAIYGRLYDWETAKKVCPKDWHLPSKTEWEALGSDASKLKATSGWNNDGNGTDEFGFSALPGGLGSLVGFDGVGNYGCWWSTDESSSVFAYGWAMYHDRNGAGGLSNYKSSSCSVRCLQD